MNSAAGLATPIPKQERIGNVEPVAQIRGAMPTGVAVSSTGRIFINYPRWGDEVEFTVGEIVNGKPVAYPNKKLNQQGNRETQSQRIVSAQSVVIDPTGSTLWIVDTGSIRPLPISYGGPKLIAIDLKTNQVSRTIMIDESVLDSETYLNDVRFLMAAGTAGYAFITDSSSNGGIIVVDLDTGENWRRLGKTRFTMSDPEFYPVVEAEILMVREKGKKAKRFNVGSDGIAVSADGKTLYFRALTSRHLYSVSTESLINRAVNEQALQTMVVDHGQVGGASDGLEADSLGRIYLTDYEHNAIHRYSRSVESVQTIVFSPEVIWPDSLSLADDGYLYFTANQLNRQQIFHNGADRRIQPYMVFRIKIDGKPIRRAQDAISQGGQSQ
ncbi:gluconolaconase [Synechococcus sp. EJ6-Ellesmere]|nr:gluconolaconase [Synechococcus sp. EJ6-Ellesmere]